MGIIRLLLAISVVIAHSSSIGGFNLVGGKIAVQAFFIISGFYMSLILNEKYIGINNSYSLFITNRFIRLFPIYWIVLIGTFGLCILSGILTNGTDFLRLNSYMSVDTSVFSFAYLVLSTIFIFGQDVVMFLGIIPENGELFFTSNFLTTNPPLHTFLFIPQAWTLGLELTFYLIAPVILTRGSKLVITIIILSFFLRLYIYNFLQLQNDPWTYRFFPTEVFFFLLGYLSYKFHLRLKTIELSDKMQYGVLLLIIAYTLLFSFIPTFSIPYFPFSVNEVIYFVSITLAIPILFNLFKHNKRDIAVGELSYPVYISHMLVVFVGGMLHIHKGLLIVLITIPVSFLLNKFIAAPIEKYRQGRLKRAESPVSVAL